MTALTMTLLPEPVAPAMSRCGILARSTALATPATSRPSAKVSFDSDAVNSTSSRTRRRGTALKSLFGTSMPTALLPAIGASIRSECAARAMARSSDRRLDPAQLDVGRRVDLVLRDDGSGVATDDARRDAEPGQLLDDDLLVAGVERFVATGMERDRDVVKDRDRRQDVLDPVLGERRVAGIGDVVRVAQRPDSGRPASRTPGRSRGRARKCWTSGPCSGRRRGSRAPRSRPTRRSGPATGPRARSCRWSALGRSAAMAASPAAAVETASSSVAVRRIEAAAVAPNHLAVPTAGCMSRRSGIPNPTMIPRIARPTSRMKAPGAVNQSVSVPASARPTRPPDTPEDLGRTHDPDVGDAHPEERDPPARPGPGPGTPFEPPAGDEEEERQQPAHRPEPRREDPGPPPGQGALARQHQRDERHRAQARAASAR